MLNYLIFFFILFGGHFVLYMVITTLRLLFSLHYFVKKKFQWFENIMFIHFVLIFRRHFWSKFILFNFLFIYVHSCVQQKVFHWYCWKYDMIFTEKLIYLFIREIALHGIEVPQNLNIKYYHRMYDNNIYSDLIGLSFEEVNVLPW